MIPEAGGTPMDASRRGSSGKLPTGLGLIAASSASAMERAASSTSEVCVCVQGAWPRGLVGPQGLRARLLAAGRAMPHHARAPLLAEAPARLMAHAPPVTALLLPLNAEVLLDLPG